MLSVIGDGMFWRRAVDPNFDAKAVMPVLTGILSNLFNPVSTPEETTRSKASETAQ